MIKLKKSLYVIPLGIVSVISLIPFYFMISMATHSTSEIYTGDILLFGSQLIKNLTTIISGGFLKYYWNSFYTAVLCVFISSMAAYGLTVYRFKGKDFLTTFIVASMMIPGQISSSGIRSR